MAVYHKLSHNMSMPNHSITTCSCSDYLHMVEPEYAQVNWKFIYYQQGEFPKILFFYLMDFGTVYKSLDLILLHNV